jgi:hypothetical protein
MTLDPEFPHLARAFRRAYLIGLLFCVAWPLALQLMLGTAIHQGQQPPGDVARQLGYTFSGLTFLIALFLTWRWGQVRAVFHRQSPDQQAATLVREVIFYSALLELTSLFGIAYFALGGPMAERYSRSFVALTTVMFFVFVPRLEAWRQAARRE